MKNFVMMSVMALVAAVAVTAFVPVEADAETVVVRRNGRVVVRNAPAVVTPAPIVVAPAAPVIVAPAPTVITPAPVVVAPAPKVVVVKPKRRLFRRNPTVVVVD